VLPCPPATPTPTHVFRSGGRKGPCVTAASIRHHWHVPIGICVHVTWGGFRYVTLCENRWWLHILAQPSNPRDAICHAVLFSCMSCAKTPEKAGTCTVRQDYQWCQRHGGGGATHTHTAKRKSCTLCPVPCALCPVPCAVYRGQCGHILRPVVVHDHVVCLVRVCYVRVLLWRTVT
jgi:hypothetical protein